LSKRIGLIIFIRNPELGKVKTRVAKTAGDEKALAIYKALLQHTRKVVSKVDCNRYLFYSQEINENDNWPSSDFNKLVQSEGDLGTKMMASFRHVLSECDSAIIIGSDCPTLTSRHIEQAINILDKADVVLGPTFDGGYYLLGMNSLHSAIFQNMQWSTERVFSESVKRLNDNGLTFETLETLSDIDYEEDWDKWGWEL